MARRQFLKPSAICNSPETQYPHTIPVVCAVREAAESGHIYIVLGPCDDGSVVILHSTPSDSRSGQPSGGVQSGAIGTSQNCTAYRLADYYMSEYYPDWYARYGISLKSPRVYFSFTSNNHGRFRWNFTGENGGLTDPDDWRNRDAEYILKNLFID